MNAILDGFRRLADFRGRTGVDAFWVYAVFVMFAGLVVGGMVIAPLASGMLAETLAFAAANPDKATVVTGPGHVSIQIHDPEGAPLPDFRKLAFTMGPVVAAIVLLLAAAVTRRLHDSGRSGWWGVPPLILLGVGVSRLPAAMETIITATDTEALRPFFLMFGVNLLYLLSLAVLLVLLVRPGVKGPNRYGAEPA